MKLAIITSRFNEKVTQGLLEGAMARAAEKGITDIKSLAVPGAVEIPLIAQRLAKSKNYDAIVCLGAVIRGETSHYDYVCEQVSQGCQQVALAFDLPVIFGILTTENAEQAFARIGKGAEAVDAAVEMVEVLRHCEEKLP